MKEYIVKRVFLAVVTIFVISAITFFAMNLIPGGPFNTEKALSPAVQKTLEERYNLDKPVYVQFGMYLKNLMHGDWGVSLKSGRDIWTDMWSKFQISAKLGGMAAIVAIIVGIVLGSIAALNRNKWPDRVIIFFTTLATAMPSFVLATLLLLVFCLQLEWVPVWSSSDELCTACHCFEPLSNGIYHKTDKNKYVRRIESGLCAYSKSEGCKYQKSYF